MARGDFAPAQLNGDRFVESSLEHPDHFSAPPLAPTESAADADILLQLEALARIGTGILSSHLSKMIYLKPRRASSHDES